MGFGEICIDTVWRIMSNNWYSIIINGTRHGFFHSTRGLKQGDSISPALFILGAEVLSRMLNLLHQHQYYKGFQMEPRGPQINHLSFADDVIIFTATNRSSIQLIMKTLENYEAMSDQLINKDKSHFMVTSKTSPETVDMIKNVTGDGILANYSPEVSSLDNTKVSHFLMGGKWNETWVRHHVHLLMVPKVLNTKIHYQENLTNEAIWTYADNGKFTCSSAWSLIRKKKVRTAVNILNWHRNIPFKASFLLWRAIRGKIPTYENLQKTGVDPTQCYCCRVPGWDNIDQNFVAGNFANYI
ncbi:hypothetical protein MTR67_015999 [Solanum verrucosum]|uniref:Reverse transcriptase domain-containing protein n=1 Tax=Solanum verrucosum TaxID=315347 RepID=A0AAF0TKK1_SOLVR|nr:hypothetical protein MTR67_015999 [Solanum verrucosum]